MVTSVSPLISLILRKLSTTYPELVSEVVDLIHMQFVKKPNSFHSMIQDGVGSRFIESFLFACPGDLLVDYYLENLILPNLLTYANHIYANYPLQALLKHRFQTEPRVIQFFRFIFDNMV